jgi:hypothetical protein
MAILRLHRQGLEPEIAGCTRRGLTWSTGEPRRGEVRYGEPVRHEYRDLWVLRFAADGRVEDFQESYWPGKPNKADAEPT